MRAIVFVPCPYCGLENKRTAELKSQVGEDELWHCDIESGGCDKQFHIRLMADVKAITRPLGEPNDLGYVTKTREEKPKCKSS